MNCTLVRPFRSDSDHIFLSCYGSFKKGFTSGTCQVGYVSVGTAAEKVEAQMGSETILRVVGDIWPRIALLNNAYGIGCSSESLEEV